MPAPIIPDVLPGEGLPIPVDEIQCSFWLLGFLPGSSRNSINPRLVLYPTQLEIKVLNTKRYAYAEIKQVSYKPAWFVMREQVIVALRDGTDYYIKPSYDYTAQRLLPFFERHGVPLSAAAQKALGR
ncbi:MAG TPA: hypothetical protein VF690_07715 [Hymenobacter sp.]|jgi:hypothetical protein